VAHSSRHLNRVATFFLIMFNSKWRKNCSAFEGWKWKSTQRKGGDEKSHQHCFFVIRFSLTLYTITLKFELNIDGNKFASKKNKIIDERVKCKFLFVDTFMAFLIKGWRVESFLNLWCEFALFFTFNIF
jgi:hypothetical protein